MTEKVTIKPEQVVSRKGGYISYYDDKSTLKKAKADQVIVSGEPAPTPQAASPETVAPAEAPATAVATPAPETPAPAPEPKPSKRGQKPKDDAQMATSKAKSKTAPKKAAKTPAKPRVPKEGGSIRTIGGKPVDVSRYEKGKAPGGGTSLNNGDAVAERLQGKDLDSVYDIVAKALKVEVKELKTKYKHLNVGMQRMNLGNRLRKVAIPKAARA